MRRGIRRRGARERGAVVAEAALVLPLLVLLLVGILEYGVAWHARNTVTGDLGSAASVAAREIGQRPSDLESLQQVESGFRDDQFSSRVRWVMIYRATSADGRPSAACMTAAAALTAGSTGVSGQCNIFSGAAIPGYTPASFQQVNCVGEPDQWFCPVGRRSALTAGDHLGVAIRYQQPWITGMLPGGGLTVTDHAVVAAAPELLAP